MMSEEAKKARREYNRKYREANKDRINAMNRERYHEDKDKFLERQAKYWERKAQQTAN